MSARRTLAPEVLDSVAAFREEVEYVKGQEIIYFDALMSTIETGIKTLHLSLIRNGGHIENNRLTGKHFPRLPANPALHMELFNRITIFRATSVVYLNTRIIPHKARTLRLIAFLEEYYGLKGV